MPENLDRSSPVLPIFLPREVWDSVAPSLRNQRYELQRWLDRKVSASERSRHAVHRAIDDVTTLIDAIDDLDRISDDDDAEVAALGERAAQQYAGALEQLRLRGD